MRNPEEVGKRRQNGRKTIGGIMSAVNNPKNTFVAPIDEKPNEINGHANNTGFSARIRPERKAKVEIETQPEPEAVNQEIEETKPLGRLIERLESVNAPQEEKKQNSFLENYFNQLLLEIEKLSSLAEAEELFDKEIRIFFLVEK
jgi:hypothetical protein